MKTGESPLDTFLKFEASLRYDEGVRTDFFHLLAHVYRKAKKRKEQYMAFLIMLNASPDQTMSDSEILTFLNGKVPPSNVRETLTAWKNATGTSNEITNLFIEIIIDWRRERRGEEEYAKERIPTLVNFFNSTIIDGERGFGLHKKTTKQKEDRGYTLVHHQTFRALILFKVRDSAHLEILEALKELEERLGRDDHWETIRIIESGVLLGENNLYLLVEGEDMERITKGLPQEIERTIGSGAANVTPNIIPRWWKIK